MRLKFDDCPGNQDKQSAGAIEEEPEAVVTSFI